MGKETINFNEIGATGLKVYAGRIDEEVIRQLRGDGWKRTLADMMNDAIINAMLNTCETLARQTSWDIKPFSDDLEDEKDAQFIRECLKDMAVTWQDTLSEIISFLGYGWYFPEICYKVRGGESRDKTRHSQFSDGKIGWRKFAPRAQESLEEWLFDDFGEITGLIQSPEPDRIWRTIPFEKALHFRTSSHKGNPEGRSILRGAYREWFFKVNIQNIEAIGIERDLAGLPVIEAPEEYFLSSADKAQKKILRDLARIAKNVRRNEEEGLVIPQAYDAKGNKRFIFSLLSTGGRRQFDTGAVIGRCDHRMLVSILADFLLLGSQATGSFALSTDKTELFSSSMTAWLDTICDQFNRNAIPRLLKLNGRNTNRLPELVHGQVERVSLEEVGDFVSQLSGAQIQFTEEEQEYLKRLCIPPQKKKAVTGKKQTDSKTTENDKEKQ